MSTPTSTATQVKTKTVSATKFAIAIACLGLAALAAAVMGTVRGTSNCTGSNKAIYPPLFGGQSVTLQVCEGDKIHILKGYGTEIDGLEDAFLEIKYFDKKEMRVLLTNDYAEYSEPKEIVISYGKSGLSDGTVSGVVLFPQVAIGNNDPQTNFLVMDYDGIVKYAKSNSDRGKLWLKVKGLANTTTCVDSDNNGKLPTTVSADGIYKYAVKYINVDIKGQITGFGAGMVETKEDVCVSMLDKKALNEDNTEKYVTKLVEYYCKDGYSPIQSSAETCQFGCEDGRCISAAELKEKMEPAKDKDVVKLNQEPTWFKNKFGKKAKWVACVDTDEISEEESEYPDHRYWNPDVKGAGTGWSPFGAYLVNAASDYCYDSEILMEFFCDEKTSMLSWGTHYCEEGCYDGVCAKIK